MAWLLVVFRAIGAWMRASGLVTGNTNEDRRVFLQAFVALGGTALLRDIPETHDKVVWSWAPESSFYTFSDDRPDSEPFTLEHIRLAVAKLEQQNVPAFPDGFYRIFTHQKQKG